MRTIALLTPRWVRVENLKQHTPLLLVLLLHLILTLAFSSLVPLGEAPDEWTQFTHARFIAKNGRLAITIAERRTAGYRSDFPPLHAIIVARLLTAVDDTPPTQLKSVGDTSRRLIPTNGQTIAAFIHTADEAWPWQGITLAWHLSRFVSIVFANLAIITTYAIAWRLTGRRIVAISAAALHAFIPQVVFIGSVLNEDSLLILLSGLILLTLIGYAKPPRLPGLWHTFMLGILLGLATVSKYNAIPLWPLVGVWGSWLTYKTWLASANKLSHKIKRLVKHLIVLLVGVILISGWWFGFVWFHFNKVDSLGLIRGSLAAFTVSTTDTTLLKISTGASIALPPAAAWLEWAVTIFKSFWGLFGGGGGIELPAWAYWLLAIICLLAIIPYVSRLTFHVSRFTSPYSLLLAPNFLLLLFLLTPLFFVALPLLRFILTGAHIAESAQGRHLFPALPAVTFGLAWGLSRLTHYALRNTKAGRPDRTEIRSAFLPLRPEIMFPIFTLILSLYALPLIQSSYPLPIPLRTTAEAATAENLLNTKLAEGVTLVGYELGQAGEGILPLTLVWQADTIPPEDYLIDLNLAGPTGQPLGGWIGHPIGGRYPTRAWDKGDILRDTIPIPLLPGASATEAKLTLRLLDTQNQPTTAPLILIPNISLSPSSLPNSSAPLYPSQLRADGLASESPFTYRSTLSFVLPDASSPSELIAPSGQVFPATRFLSGSDGSIAHFIVAANWPSGNYHFTSPGSRLTFHVSNRPRQFEPPPMDYVLDANFADYITLLGYDLPQRQVQPGQSFPVTLHLRAERILGQNLVIFNHLLDQDAIQRGGEDRIPLKFYTTLLWVPGEIVSDPYEVFVEATAPPGVYWLDMGLYPSDQPNFSLPLFIDGHSIDRNSVRLGPFKVGGPPPGITVSEIQAQQAVNKNFGDQITLLGFNLTDVDGSSISPADKGMQATRHVQYVIRNRQHVTLTLFWRADTPSSTNYTVFVHLLDSEGKLAAQFDSPPAADAYPTSLWDPGEIIVDERLLNDLPPGRYTLQVGLYRPDTSERLPVEGSVDGAVRLMDLEVE